MPMTGVQYIIENENVKIIELYAFFIHCFVILPQTTTATKISALIEYTTVRQSLPEKRKNVQ